MANPVVEDIKSRINIVDFISQYIRLNKAGANWKARCPFHNEKTPSFMVSEDKQIWHCFGCQKGGDVFGFLMEMEALSFKEALKILAEKTGVEIPKYNYSSKTQAVEMDRTHEILELSVKFYETQLWQGLGKTKILDYLRGRGLKDAELKKFRVGYAPPGWRNLLDFLIGRGYATENIAKTGLLVKKENNFKFSVSGPSDVAGNQVVNNNYYDRFRDRITFPVADLMGKVVGFSARMAPGGDESQAKYVNTPETAIYHKSKILYGIDKAKKEIKEKDEVILVEGNTDVIAAHQIGFGNTIAVSGTALTPDQLDIIKRYSQNIKMFFDMDSAGQNAALRSAELALQKGLNVYIIESAFGKDAAEIISKDPKMFAEAVAQAKPVVEYFFAKLLDKYDKNNPTDKKKIVEEILKLVYHIENEIEKNHWLKIISEKLEIDFRVLADLFYKMKEKERRFENRVKNEEAVPSEYIGEDRLNLIVKKIIGLMLAHPPVWKMILEKCADDPVLLSIREFQILSQNGEKCGFAVDELLIVMEDDDLKKNFQRAAFESRYYFSEEIGAEEIDDEKAIMMAENYLAELNKEKNRQKRRIIQADIEKAEKEGDKEAVRALMREFNSFFEDLK